MSDLNGSQTKSDEVKPRTMFEKKIAEKILKEMLTEEFSMSYSMILYSVQLIELTDKSKYKCTILYGKDIQTDIRKITILINSTNMNLELQKIVDKIHAYLLNN